MMNDRFPDRNSRRAPTPSAERGAEGSAGRRGGSDGRRPSGPGPEVPLRALAVIGGIVIAVILILVFA